MKIISLCFIFLLVCRIFSFEDSCGQGNTEKAINEWLKDKKIISVTQTTGEDNNRHNTYITIIAEV